MMPQDVVATHWSLDKRVPIALVVSMVAQSIIFVWVGSWWVAKLDSRVAITENRLAQIETQEREQAASRRVNIDRLSRLEVDYSTTKNEINRRLDRMEQKVDQILERLPRP